MSTLIKLREWKTGVAMTTHSMAVSPKLIEVVLRLARLELQPKAEAVGAITMNIGINIEATCSIETCKDFVLPKKEPPNE
jgi:hypothetical protein